MIILPSGREIGEGRKPFVIAEVGSNWASLEHCLQSIERAKVAGADAVKFQLFNDMALYGMNRQIAVLNSDGEYVMKNIENKHALPVEWIPTLKSEADKSKIEFMCSAFSPELLEVVDPYVNIHKLASAEMTHVRMLEKLKQIGKPVIMSTGASSAEDIKKSIEILRTKVLTYDGLWSHSEPEVILLYCVANYPAREINLENINELKRVFSIPVGFSDHSMDCSVIPAQAVNKGACVIEKHFQACDGIFPDTGHSLNTPQFGRMVWTIHNKQVPNIEPVAEETEMVHTHNRRLIAICDIKTGDKLIEGENFGIFRSIDRSNSALSPFRVNEVNGKTARSDIQKGQGITSFN